MHFRALMPWTALFALIQIASRARFQCDGVSAARGSLRPLRGMPGLADVDPL